MTGVPWWRGHRGEWWVVGQGVLIAALALAPAVWTWAGPSRGLWRALGGVLIAAGVTLASTGIVQIGRDNLTALPHPPARATLIQTGIYARVRHPMYGGLIVAALGWALWKTSGLHLILAAALTAYLYAKAGYEESFLAARFPEYQAYRTRTKQLLPWIL
jgi:protein-S-isoprenylcysteine O-methyltransferase Ste14